MTNQVAPILVDLYPGNHSVWFFFGGKLHKGLEHFILTGQAVGDTLITLTGANRELSFSLPMEVIS